MALITLLRHAPLSKELQKRYIGHTNANIDNSLTELSKLNIIKSRKYDFIYSSDLKRCTQTLDLINVTYKEDSRLREVKFKDEFECKNFKEVEMFESFDSKYLCSASSWHNYICDESIEEFRFRVQEFINELPKDKHILICTHAGTIRMLNSILTNYDYENSYLKVEYLDRIEIVI